jgi:hypothetical protein
LGPRPPLDQRSLREAGATLGLRLAKGSQAASRYSPHGIDLGYTLRGRALGRPRRGRRGAGVFRYSHVASAPRTSSSRGAVTIPAVGGLSSRAAGAASITKRSAPRTSLQSCNEVDARCRHADCESDRAALAARWRKQSGAVKSSRSQTRLDPGPPWHREVPPKAAPARRLACVLPRGRRWRHARADHPANLIHRPWPRTSLPTPTRPARGAGFPVCRHRAFDFPGAAHSPPKLGFATVANICIMPIVNPL